jgi:hypothetical protein
MHRLALVAVAILAAGSRAEAQEPGLVRKLVTTIVRDVKQLPSKDNLPILLNGAALAIGVHPIDEVATHGASSSKILKASFAGYGKAVGREWAQGGVALGAYIAGRLWSNERLVAASGDLIEAQLVSAAVTQATKFVVQRTRPDGEARSFPSGHASAAFATAAVLHRHYGRKVSLPAYAIAVYTSASRLQANSHYASDVIAGAALGIAIGRTATIDVGRHRLQIAPAPVSGGIAVVAAVH